MPDLGTLIEELRILGIGVKVTAACEDARFGTTFTISYSYGDRENWLQTQVGTLAGAVEHVHAMANMIHLACEISRDLQHRGS